MDTTIDKGTRAYIFDYGGTLDTGGNHWGKVLWHAYERVGVPVSEARFREAYVYAERTLGRNPIIQPDFTFRQTLDEKLRLELDYLHCGEWRQQVLDVLYADVKRHTSASRAVLQQLSQSYPMVLVSNFYGNIATVLDEFALGGLFGHIIESAVVGVRKPDPRIFTLGVEALGMDAAQVTVVGDSVDKDIIPAHEAGCQTVWIRGEQWTDDAVDERIPDRIIDSLEELIETNK